MSSTAYDNLGLADTDISMAQSWAPKEPHQDTFLPALQLQVDGPMPNDPRHKEAFSSSVLAYDLPEAQHLLQHSLTFHTQNDAEDPNQTPTFLSPDEKYHALSGPAPIGGLLLVATLALPDGTTTAPLFMVTSPPGVAKDGTTYPYQDITVLDFDNIPLLKDDNRDPDDHCYPATVSVWSSSRASPLKEFPTAFANSDDCHLFTPKAQKLLRTAVLPIDPLPDNSPAPRPDDWTAAFWLGDAATTTATLTASEDQPPRLEATETVFVTPTVMHEATRFHTALTAIPLPPRSFPPPRRPRPG